MDLLHRLATGEAEQVVVAQQVDMPVGEAPAPEIGLLEPERLADGRVDPLPERRGAPGDHLHHDAIEDEDALVEQAGQAFTDGGRAGHGRTGQADRATGAGRNPREWQIA